VLNKDLNDRTAVFNVSLSLVSLAFFLLNRREKQCIKRRPHSVEGLRPQSCPSRSNIKMSNSSSHTEPFSAYNMTGNSTQRHAEDVLKKFDAAIQTVGSSSDSSSSREEARNLSSLSQRSSEGSRGSSISSRGYVNNSIPHSQTSSRGASTRGSSAGRSSGATDRSSASSY
jgi:hypothetical protein